MNEKVRNGEISILRFIFAMCVLLCHIPKGLKFKFSFGSLAQYGSFGVEFFFLISGVLLCKHYYNSLIDENKKIDEVWSYTIKKVSYLYPYYIVSLITLWFVALYKTRNLRVMVIKIIKSIPLFLFINEPIYYISDTLYSTGNWYLSALFICTPIVCALILYKKDFYTKFLAPLFSILIMGYMIYKYQGIQPVHGKDFIVGGLLRGFAEMSLGVFCFECTKYIQNIKINEKFCCIIKYICFAIPVLYAIGYFKNTYVVSILLICALGVVLSFSEKGFYIKENIWTKHLSKMSLMIYITQGVIYYVFNSYKLFYDNKIIYNLMVIICTFVLSEFVLFFTDKVFMKVIKKFKIIE